VIPPVLPQRNVAELDPTTGLLAFDTFNTDGLLGDQFLVNGKIQPFFEVQKRRYRFRILDFGPSRFYQLYLTNPDNPNQSIPYWIIANDGNLLPRPIEVTNHRIGVAERFDCIIDFAKIAARFGNPSRIRLENRLVQDDGRGPSETITPPGQGNQLLELRPVGGAVVDNSFDPEPVSFPHVPASATDAVFAPISLPGISKWTRTPARLRSGTASAWSRASPPDTEGSRPWPPPSSRAGTCCAGRRWPPAVGVRPSCWPHAAPIPAAAQAAPAGPGRRARCAPWSPTCRSSRS
jgi:FtsP/CotA-like multicopper oxidase with cupredoxin domain